MKTSTRQELGPRLREIREERRLSMKQVAGRAGVSLTALGRWERGVALPGLDVAVELAALLGTSVDYLATGVAPRGSAPFQLRAERFLRALAGVPREVREDLAALLLAAEAGTAPAAPVEGAA